ncbi:TadE/TadG family type IV pilus assembly protein [Vibrio sp. RC27]
MMFRRIKNKQQGVSSIEFAMGFILFWYMCAAWIEMSFLSYISAIGDLAISRASQVAKKNEGDTEDFIQDFNAILQQSSSLWSYAANSNDFRITVQYLQSFEKLTQYDGSCGDSDESITECGEAEGAAIALYRFDYSYSPIFTTFLSDESLFSREMIVIQEYQRSEFIVY